MALQGVLILPTGAEIQVEVSWIAQGTEWSASVLLTASQALQFLTAGRGNLKLKVADGIGECRAIRRDLSLTYGGTVELVGIGDLLPLS